MAVDTFGITQLHTTKTGGWNWTSTWHNGVSRNIRPTENYMFPPVNGVNRDSQDQEFLVLGYNTAQTYFIPGDGILRWVSDSKTTTTNTARWYIMDYPDGLANEWEIKNENPARKMWTNVEFTGYVRLWSITAGGAVRLAARSNHFNIHQCECDGSGYDFQLGTANTTNQAARAGKEVIHDAYSQWSKDSQAPTPSTTNNNQLFHPNQTAEYNMVSYDRFSTRTYLPLTKWIGMKFVLRTMTGSGYVRQEGYIDKSNGKNGGEWLKVIDFIDNGIDGGVFKDPALTDIQARWATTGGCGEDFALNTSRFISTPVVNQANPVFLRAAYACYFRLDSATAFDLKWFTCREIDPLS